MDYLSASTPSTSPLQLPESQSGAMSSFLSKKRLQYHHHHLNQQSKLKKKKCEDLKARIMMEDERRVEEGTCSFPVKYLGCKEVSECRGLDICEQAIKALSLQSKTHRKAHLNISGDSIRVMDHATTNLIVDDPIEKISFCAPDRYNDRGFAYICRESASRCWICHAFLSKKKSGGRVSHAVGSAFQICVNRTSKNMINPLELTTNGCGGVVCSSGGNDKPGFDVVSSNYEGLQSLCTPISKPCNKVKIKKLSVADRLRDPQLAKPSVATFNMSCNGSNRNEKDNSSATITEANRQMWAQSSSVRSRPSANRSNVVGSKSTFPPIIPLLDGILSVTTDNDQQTDSGSKNDVMDLEENFITELLNDIGSNDWSISNKNEGHDCNGRRPSVSLLSLEETIVNENYTNQSTNVSEMRTASNSDHPVVVPMTDGQCRNVYLRSNYFTSNWSVNDQLMKRTNPFL